jgi:hypothetical protein
VVCPRIGLPDAGPAAASAPCDGVGVEWFADRDHLRRFEEWAATVDGRAALDCLAPVLSLAGSPVMFAEERVMRGDGWLAERWLDGGERIKQMAIARRAPGLTPAAFSELWQSRAGRLGSSSGATVVIPDEARGCAYVQNHPLLDGDASWPYDAVNEVYFDDLDSLRSRVDWFAAHLKDGVEDDLVGESWFVNALEVVVWGGTPLSR